MFEREAVNVKSLKYLCSGSILVTVSGPSSGVNLFKLKNVHDLSVSVEIPGKFSTCQILVFDEEACYVESDTQLHELIQHHTP